MGKFWESIPPTELWLEHPPTARERMGKGSGSGPAAGRQTQTVEVVPPSTPRTTPSAGPVGACASKPQISPFLNRFIAAPLSLSLPRSSLLPSLGKQTEEGKRSHESTTLSSHRSAAMNSTTTAQNWKASRGFGSIQLFWDHRSSLVGKGIAFAVDGTAVERRTNEETKKIKQ